jgi:hypothetical protein
VGERFGNHRNAIDAARDVRVSLIVYTSILNASPTRMRLADEHRRTEAYPRDSSRLTAAVSLPSFNSRSAVISLRTTCSGLCLFLVAMILSSLSTHVVGRKTLIRPGLTDRGQAKNIKQRKSVRTDVRIRERCLRRQQTTAVCRGSPVGQVTRSGRVPMPVPITR